MKRCGTCKQYKGQEDFLLAFKNPETFAKTESNSCARCRQMDRDRKRVRREEKRSAKDDYMLEELEVYTYREFLLSLLNGFDSRLSNI